MRVVVTTTASRLRGALHTAETVRGHHPEWPVTVAVVDHATGDVTLPDGVEVVRAAVGAPHRPDDGVEAHRLRMLHTPDERVTLLHPRQLLGALDGAGAVISLPDDAVVVAPLTPMISALTDRSVVLSPVRRAPLPRDGRTPDDRVLLDIGPYEPALLAVRADAAGRELLAWWCAALDRHPLLEPDRLDPLVVPWLEMVPSQWPAATAVLARPLAQWSANADDPASADAVVVRLPGFDPARPWLAEPAMGDWPRVLVSEHPLLRDAATARARAMRREDAAEERREMVPSGLALLAPMRSMYRDALHAAERHGTPEPPNPYVPGGMVPWLEWISAPEAPGSPITRYVRELTRTRADLAAHDEGALLLWARRYGVGEGHPARALGVLLPDEPAAERVRAGGPPPVTPGISLVGLLRAEFGMGEAARQTLQAVTQAGVPVSVVTDTGATQRQQEDDRWSGAVGLLHDVQVVVANADALPGVVARLGLDAPAVRGEPVRRVGVWFWEADRFPPPSATPRASPRSTRSGRRARSAATSSPLRSPAPASRPTSCHGRCRAAALSIVSALMTSLRVSVCRPAAAASSTRSTTAASPSGRTRGRRSRRSAARSPEPRHGAPCSC